VSPEGTTLTINANPTTISTSSTSTITVTARKPNGTPVNPGTEIQLSTDLGTVDGIITTDDRGIAVGTLQAGNETGDATVTARSGSAAEVTASVQIGFDITFIGLTVSPTTIPAQGGTLRTEALVRDEVGTPAQDIEVRFTAEAGSFDSGNGVVVTNKRGEAKDRLRVTEVELAALGTSELIVEAEVIESAGAGESDTFIVDILSAPAAAFTTTISERRVSFLDTSTGNPTSWQWDFGDGRGSTEQNPVYTYRQDGTYLVILTVANSQGSSTASSSISVSAP
jgi:hypothetical protein